MGKKSKKSENKEEVSPTKLKPEPFECNEEHIKEGEDPNNPVRVYADGVFDIFHFGHARVLEQAKKLFKYTTLVVGVAGDADTLKFKGKVVMSEYERTECVKNCKWADEVIMPCPWIITVDFLRQHNIRYVAHDAIPYSGDGGDDIYAEVKKLGMFKETQRTEGISTSDLILRIIKDYDEYVWRNLKRGYSAKDLNISSLQATKYKFKSKFEEVKDKLVNEHVGKSFDDNLEKFKGKVGTMFDKWRNNSDKFFTEFLLSFNKNNPKITQIVNDTLGRYQKKRAGDKGGKSPTTPLTLSEAEDTLVRQVIEIEREKDSEEIEFEY